MPKQNRSRQKAQKLPVSTQVKIAKHYRDGNKNDAVISYNEIANLYNCTANQVRYYVSKLDAGEYKLNKRSESKKELAEIADEISNTTDAEFLLKQIRIIEAQIATKPDMPIAERTDLVSTLALANSRFEQMRKVRLENNRIKAEQNFLFALCKHFQPDISEKSAIDTCKEVRDMLDD